MLGISDKYVKTLMDCLKQNAKRGGSGKQKTISYKELSQPGINQ